MILVTGATGNIGKHVVRQLLDAGQKVRAITRDPGRCTMPDDVEVVAGDLTRPQTLPAALRGVDSLFLFPVFGALRGPLDAARRAGVEHVVMLSSQAVAYVVGEPHIECEEAVAGSGLSWTFVRPSVLMANDLAWAPQIANGGTVRGVYGSAATAAIDERDIAAVAVRALLTPRSGTAYTVTGPQSLTQIERVRIIGEAIDCPTRFEELPREHVRQQMLAHMPAAVVDAMLDLRASLQGSTAEVLPTVETVTGRPPHTYAEWLAYHERDFRPDARL